MWAERSYLVVGFLYMNKQGLEKYIADGDYFGTLATVLDLVRQALEEKQKGPKQAWYMQSLKNVKDDLMFLQGEYKIVKKQNTDE